MLHVNYSQVLSGLINVKIGYNLLEKTFFIVFKKVFANLLFLNDKNFFFCLRLIKEKVLNVSK